MDVLTGSLDGGAKESGLTGIPGFQAKEHFLWSGVDTGRERACLEGGGPRRDVVGPPTLNVEDLALSRQDKVDAVLFLFLLDWRTFRL